MPVLKDTETEPADNQCTYVDTYGVRCDEVKNVYKSKNGKLYSHRYCKTHKYRLYRKLDMDGPATPVITKRQAYAGTEKDVPITEPRVWGYKNSLHSVEQDDNCTIYWHTSGVHARDQYGNLITNYREDADSKSNFVRPDFKDLYQKLYDRYQKGNYTKQLFQTTESIP